MHYYDIGVNLFCRQFRDPETVIRRAGEAGVCCILTGTDMPENRRIAKFLKTHEAYGTCGVHPHNADSLTDADLAEMERILRENPRIAAVGECGLDYDRMFSTKENQRRALREQIALAARLQKPLFLHEREAEEDLAAAFRECPELCSRSVVHCFTGGRKTLERYLEMGFFIGITGWICDERRADALRDAVRILPPERVMIETDAPYLIPRGIPGLGRVNVPENVRYVAAALAQYMGISEPELLRAAKENTERFFGLPIGNAD